MKSSISKSSISKLSLSSRVFVAIALSIGLISCKVAQEGIDGQVRDNDSVSAQTLPSYPQAPTIQTLDEKREAKIIAHKVAENIELSQAKLAAKRRDVCPKLLSRDVDTRVLTRAKEVLNSDYCDYYIYPNVGEHLSVTSNSDVVAASLVSPIVFDFANGSYVAEQTDKHTIRLSYIGSEFRDSSINYDITVIID